MARAEALLGSQWFAVQGVPELDLHLLRLEQLRVKVVFGDRLGHLVVFDDLP